MNKEIIIDGVNITGCEFYLGKNGHLPYCQIGLVDDASIYDRYCDFNKDCYYKQLQRKKQECKLLKSALKNKNFVAAAEENEKLKQECEELKIKNMSLKANRLNMFEHLEIVHLNKFLKVENSILKQYKKSKQASYEALQKKYLRTEDERRNLQKKCNRYKELLGQLLTRRVQQPGKK